LVDPAIVGTELGSVSFPIESSKLMELSKALLDEEPNAWTVPLTVTALVAHWSPAGAVGTPVALGMELARVLHGETTWQYVAPVSVGDRLTARSRVADVTQREGRRGGLMTLVTLETEYTNQRDELTMRQRDVLIERGG
jgi:acyl dehydratase